MRLQDFVQIEMLTRNKNTTKKNYKNVQCEIFIYHIFNSIDKAKSMELFKIGIY